MRPNIGKRWHVFAIATFLFVVAAVAQQKVEGKKWQPLNVKPGLWESTRTWTTVGELPIPSGTLDRLTPEQRARLEERIKAQSAANNHTDTDKNCVTKEDLQNPPKFTDKAECNWTILESTSTKAKGNGTCRVEGMELTGTGEFEAPDQEHINASIHLTSTSGGHSMTTDATIKSKWLGSSCSVLK
jgi:uncharacterized protein DUF3617